MADTGESQRTHQLLSSRQVSDKNRGLSAILFRFDQPCHLPVEYLDVETSKSANEPIEQRFNKPDPMTKPRKKPTTTFHGFLVEPTPGFRPTNWRQNPKYYRILEFIGTMHFKGRADAWKFLHNHEQMNHGPIKQWAIYLDFDSSDAATKQDEQNEMVVSIRRQNLVAHK